MVFHVFHLSCGFKFEHNLHECVCVPPPMTPSSASTSIKAKAVASASSQSRQQAKYSWNVQPQHLANPGPSGPLGALLLRCASGSVGHVDQLQKVLAANTEILGWPCWEVSEALASRRVPMNKSNNLRKERWHRYQINFKLGQCDWTFLAFPPVFIALNMFRRT